MLSLSETCGYAILALACLDQCQGRLVLARQLAAATGIPLPYLAKILHALTKSGLVSSKRGYRGGFRLTREASAITLLDVVTAVDGQAVPECLLGLSECKVGLPCPTHDFWSIERERILAELRRLTLHEVAQFEQRRHPLALQRCCAESNAAGPATAIACQPASAPAPLT